MRITSLEIENVKRIRAVRITPEGNVVTIGGRNAQGKTSVLDAIEMAIGGKPTGEPLRRGERKGYVIAQIGDLTVERRFTLQGNYLDVRDSDGEKVTSPQKILDELYGQLTFDPIAFMRAKPKAQIEMLREMLHLDFAQLDRDREQEYDARTEIKRKIQTLDEQIKAMPHFEDVDEERSNGELIEELRKVEIHNTTVSDARTQVVRLQGAVASADAAVESAKARVDRARVETDEAELQRKTTTSAQKRAVGVARAAEKAAGQLHEQDPEPVRARMAELDDWNTQWRANEERRVSLDVLKTQRKTSADYTRHIEDIDGKKKDAVEAAEMPIEGLTFDEDGLRFDDVPLQQASGAEQLRVSVAMAMAANPKLKIALIRDGSLLDDDSMKLLEELAVEHDGQVFIERVGKGAECSVIIEDGEVETDGE